jgi:hypothetical protein
MLRGKETSMDNTLEEVVMTLGLAYWILLLVACVFGFALHFGYASTTWGVGGNSLLLLALLIILGWQVFGPPLHR